MWRKDVHECGQVFSVTRDWANGQHVSCTTPRHWVMSIVGNESSRRFVAKNSAEVGWQSNTPSYIAAQSKGNASSCHECGFGRVLDTRPAIAMYLFISYAHMCRFRTLNETGTARSLTFAPTGASSRPPQIKGISCQSIDLVVLPRQCVSGSQRHDFATTWTFV